MGFLMRCWKALFSFGERRLPASDDGRVYYGTTTDGSIRLDKLPRKYPTVMKKYQLDNDPDRVFQVADLDINDETIVIQNLDTGNLHELDIDLFEELLVSVDPNENYPM